MLASCATLDDLATPDLGDFGPSEAGVRALLEEDRVREALVDARRLSQRYGGTRTRVLLAWAQWRNGDLIESERGFRPAAENGEPRAAAGLARVMASRGQWHRAVELASSAVESSRAERLGRAVLASAAWWRRDATEAASALRAWSDVESEAGIRPALAAMALAVDELEGPVLRLQGDAGLVELDPGHGIRVGLGDRSLRLLLDPASGQTRVSPDVAEEVGLLPRRGGPPEGEPAPPLPIFAFQQAAVDELRLGEMVVRDLVVGVGPVPEGFDGILGADLLARLRWSLRPDRQLLAVGPPQAGRGVERLVAGREAQVIAWLGARVAVHGLGVQLLFHPRVGGRALPAELDLTGPSTLDRVHDEGRTDLTVAGRRWDVVWEERSLVHRARGGAVAPQALLGAELFHGRVVHWVPETAQLRVEEPVESPGG